jgi:N-acetylmuramic acid 6-phosphate etherase
MSALEIARVMNDEDARVALAIQQELPQIARAIEEIAARLRRNGRLIYVGAGTSGRLGVLDAAECPPTFNVSPDTVIGLLAGGPIAQSQAQEDQEDSVEAGEAEVRRLHLSADDVVVGIAASGRTPYALGAIAYANALGAFTIGIACNKNTPIEHAVQLMIAPVVGPEVITGSTRLKAGTAGKDVWQSDGGCPGDQLQTPAARPESHSDNHRTGKRGGGSAAPAGRGGSEDRDFAGQNQSDTRRSPDRPGRPQ